MLDASVSVHETLVSRPEYPRPDLDRSHAWLNLNGEWDFAPVCHGVDTGATGIGVSQWPMRITVPFAWETPASGVGLTWLAMASYRRRFTVPTGWTTGRVILCFGAVHHRAEVWVNGSPVGVHEGGYTPFEFDVTDALVAGQESELVVGVNAPHDKREIVHGKQRSLPRDDYDGVAFTPSSGIWQTVWLESRPATAAAQVVLRGETLQSIEAEVRVEGPNAAGATVRLTLLDQVADVGAGVQAQVAAVCPDGATIFRAALLVPDPALWSPQNPHVYRVEVAVNSADGTDRLVASTGLRRIETKQGHLFLNGQQIYLRGVLDQGYWPESGITAPSDDALRRDIQLAKEAGFTMVRKHLKFEDPRWLYWADQMGMLVWEEPACPSRFGVASVEAFERQIPVMVARDGNHPCIIIWALYNEEWSLDWDVEGQADKQEVTRHAYDLLAELDHSRPIVDDSGWSHVKTDLVDWHAYTDDPATWAQLVQDLVRGASRGIPVPLAPGVVIYKQIHAGPEFVDDDLPFLNSEYGGGSTNAERTWQLRWQTQELRRHDRMTGYVYTELTDIEHETAGLYNADRTPKDSMGIHAADTNAETVLIVDIVPLEAGTDIAAAPGDVLHLPVRVSHHGIETVRGRVCVAWTSQCAPHPLVKPDPVAFSPVLEIAPFHVTDPVILDVAVPEGAPSARLLLWLETADAAPVAQAVLDVGFRENIVGPGRLVAR